MLMLLACVLSISWCLCLAARVSISISVEPWDVNKVRERDANAYGWLAGFVLEQDPESPQSTLWMATESVDGGGSLHPIFITRMRLLLLCCGKYRNKIIKYYILCTCVLACAQTANESSNQQHNNINIRFEWMYLCPQPITCL